MDVLKGKVAVVTGAGQGIGRAVALGLAQEGAKVVVNDLGTGLGGQGQDAQVADLVVQEIKDMGGDAMSNTSSVADFAEMQKMIEQAVEKFGKIDIVVNNAGIVKDRMLFNMAEEEWDAVIAVCLKGSFNVTRAAAPYFRSQKSGRVINLTSTAGLIGNIGQANYASAKLGIVGLTRSTAIDMARANVTANAIAPFAWSRMTSSIPTDTEENRRRVEKYQQMTPDLIAPLVNYLASDAAADVSGQVFCVRGKEILLFSQPRPIRSGICLEGWTPESIGASLKESFKSSFSPLETSANVFPYDPIV